ncbi:MAG: hypothetical protein WEB37_08630 [Bacteroidota bacterium]
MRKVFLTILALFLYSTGIAQFRTSGQQVKAPSFELQEPEPGEKKSILLAVGLSLVLPGSGELYAGNVRTGTYLMATDGALWLTYTGFLLHGNWIMEDARNFASIRAGADFSGKDDRFDVNIGNFISTAVYNETRLRNREYGEIYSAPGYEWFWLQDSDRLHYRNLRIKSDQIHQASEFVIGALVINRIVSAFLAWRSVQSYNAANRLQSGWLLETEVQHMGGTVHGLGLKVTAPF